MENGNRNNRKIQKLIILHYFTYWNTDFVDFPQLCEFTRGHSCRFLHDLFAASIGVFTATELGLCLCGEGTIDVSEWKVRLLRLLRLPWWYRMGPGTSRKKLQNLRWKPTKYNVPDLETHGLSFSNVLLCPLGGLHIGIVKGLVVFAFKTMPWHQKQRRIWCIWCIAFVSCSIYL